MKQPYCRYFSVLPLALLLLLGWSAYLPTPVLATDLPVYGGPGGNSFRADCPKGSYLVDLAGRAGSWVDRIAPVCAPWLRGSQTFGAASIGQSFGMSMGGQERQTLCRELGGNRHAIQSWWIHLLRSDDSYVQFIQVYCASLTAPASDVSGRRLDFGVKPDVEEMVASGPFPSQPPFQACPAGEVAVGFRIRTGRFVDAIGLVCGPIPAKFGAPATKLPSPLVQAPSPPPATKLPGPLVQAPPSATPMNPQAKNMRVPDDMFVITKPAPAASDHVPQGQLIVIATLPKVGATNVTELELRYLDAPPTQRNSYPYVTVFSVDTSKLVQGYPVAEQVTGGYVGRWQVRVRSSMKTPAGPWSFPVQFQLVKAQPPPPMVQMPKPIVPIMQMPATNTGVAPAMVRPPTTSSQGSGAFGGMIRLRGVEEKGGKEGNETVDTTPETEKKP